MKRMLLVGFILAMAVSSQSKAEVPGGFAMPQPQPIFNPGMPMPVQPIVQNRTVINTTRITVNTIGQHGLYSPYGMYGYPYGSGYGYGYGGYGYRPGCYPGMYGYGYGGFCGRRRHRRSFFLSIGGFFTLSTRSF